MVTPDEVVGAAPATMRWARIVVAAALLVAIAVAWSYIYGPWPESVIMELRGPAGARLVKIDGDNCDLPIPIRKVMWRRNMRFPDECPLELELAGGRLCGRVDIEACGGVITGHTALLGAAESRDGSAWLRTGTSVIDVRAPVEGGAWFTYTPWGKTALSVHGEQVDKAAHHFVLLDAVRGRPSELESSRWRLRIDTGPGVSVQLTEWIGVGDGVTEVILDDSGFRWGAVESDGGSVELDLDHTYHVEAGAFALRLGSSGQDVQTTIELSRDSLEVRWLSLRVSRSRN